MPPSTPAEFDFNSHGRNAADNYREIRPKYESFADVVKQILVASIPPDCPVHSIEVRAKSVESFEKKAKRPSETDPTKPRYIEPLGELTDLAGIRVITFFPKILERIDECINREFTVTWKRDVGEERFSQGRFGYQSIHYLVKLMDSRVSLAEYAQYADLIAEIQVRTIMQHAWAEMEHDIQYKSIDQIPKSLERRFVALAGMLEIADREFQAIQDEDARLRSAVRASLQDDLTKTGLLDIVDVKAKKKASLEDGLTEAITAVRNLHKESPGSVRALVAVGNYEEAITLYSEMLEATPTIYTLYIGRAKARFLAGDRTGALEDLEIAQSKLPDDPGIRFVTSQIEEGAVSKSTTADSWKFRTRGVSFLAAGRGEEAFKMFSLSQEAGFNFFFATINKAMACTLMKDDDGASYFLDQVKAIPGTPAEIIYLAIRAIVAAIAKTAPVAAQKALKAKISEIPEFEFDLSPLKDLEAGFKKRDVKVAERIKEVFAILKGAA